MTLDVRPLDLPGLLEIVPRRHGDHRGFFSEVYKKSVWDAAGVRDVFVQDNASFSAEPFTLRGLHFQTPPFAQGKLVRVVRGRIWDVAVDIRAGSPTFGRWAAIEVSAEKGNQIYIPAGFAHGLLTLEPDTEVAYKVTAEYSAAHDTGVAWDDPDIAVAWPLNGATPVLSAKDRTLPQLADIASPVALRG
jgi:dTDP-4-dehydrorhamnose 3,5-epimerase